MKRNLDDCKHSIFISYSNENKQSACKIADEFEKLNFKIWINRNLNGEVKLYSEISSAIFNSDIVVCLISKNYCQSRDCLREIKYADQKKKKILPILMETISPILSNGIDFLICDLVCFDSYEKPNTFESFDQHFQNLKSFLFKSVNQNHEYEVCSEELKCSNQEPV